METNNDIKNMIVNDDKTQEKDFEYLKILRNKIENMDTLHHKEILRIFQDSSCNISSNRNGSFVNLSEVSDVIVGKIEKYLKHVEIQEKELKEKNDVQVNIETTFF